MERSLDRLCRVTLGSRHQVYRGQRVGTRRPPDHTQLTGSQLIEQTARSAGVKEVTGVTAGVRTVPTSRQVVQEGGGGNRSGTQRSSREADQCGSQLDPASLNVSVFNAIDNCSERSLTIWTRQYNYIPTGNPNDRLIASLRSEPIFFY